ncbi:MAG TPA: IS21 family transposase [Myxococcales bacterium]|nr:IS21 family transposase [Myxococcales bacterium]
MITAEMRAQMRRLVLVDGLKIETVARRFGVHHSVVRRSLREPGKAPPAVPRPSKLEPWKPFIVQRLTELPLLTSTRLFMELRDRGYTGSAKHLRRYVAQVREPRSRKAYLRVEFEPAEQAQVDWGSFGYLRVGTSQRPLSLFSMVLSWSRAIFIDFSLDQQMETFCRMHRQALEFFGGVPRRVIYDNLKSVVLHHVGATVQFNPRFLAFAGHYLFEPTAAPARYPEFKGRVEASIKFIRHSFFYGRSFSGLDDLRAQAARWRDEIANERIHATTRERPAQRLLVERPRLRALPPHPFDTDIIVPLVVSKEARVRFDCNSYSVPTKLVGKTVQLRADDRRLRIMCDGVEVAAHARCWDKHRHIEDPAHVRELLDRRKAGRGPSRRERLVAVCPEARLYLHEVARRRIRLDRELEKLFRLIDMYGEADVAAAIANAIVQRSFGARYVRALCDQARFARGQGEPPEPVITGNHAADSATVDPHPMESYDALFNTADE